MFNRKLDYIPLDLFPEIKVQIYLLRHGQDRLNFNVGFKFFVYVDRVCLLFLSFLSFTVPSNSLDNSPRPTR